MTQLNYYYNRYKIKINELAHNALTDAKYQAKYVRQMLLKLQ